MQGLCLWLCHVWVSVSLYMKTCAIADIISVTCKKKKETWLFSTGEKKEKKLFLLYLKMSFLHATLSEL